MKQLLLQFTIFELKFALLMLFLSLYEHKF